MTKPFSKLSTGISPLVLALALAFPLGATAATQAAAKPTAEQLQSEIDELKKQVAELKKMVMDKVAAPAPVVVQVPPPPAPKPVATVDPAEFNRIRVKVEAMEDTQETSGLKGLKISGYTDPTYIYNARAHKGSFQFLNAQDGEVNDLKQDAFGYDNSNFGGVTIKFEKDLGGGITSTMTLRPEKSATGTGSIVEEAILTVPLGNGMAATAGKIISFNGYEYSDAYQNKAITHNLLWDFGGPSFVTGAGLNFNLAGMAFKTMVGNLNTYRNLPGDNNAGGHWRGDVTLGEFSGWGVSGMHGKIYGSAYNYLEADFWYARGDWSFNGQVEGSQLNNGAFNGGNATTTGVSLLAAYKLTPEWEAHIRGDYLDNSKNGGGGAAIVFGTPCPDDGTGVPASICGDYRNGFGPGVDYNAGTGIWELGNNNKGTKRTALTFGVNYQYNDNGLLKFEYRYDHSNLNSFVNQNFTNWKNSNSLVGVQTVMKF